MRPEAASDRQSSGTGPHSTSWIGTPATSPSIGASADPLPSCSSRGAALDRQRILSERREQPVRASSAPRLLPNQLADGRGRPEGEVIMSLSLPPEVIDAVARRAVDLLLADAAGPSDVPSSPYMTVAEAASYARCSRQRIYDLRSSGRLSRHADGSRALVDRRELDGYLGAA
jgi:excisionase family DNA binding protein